MEEKSSCEERGGLGQGRGGGEGAEGEAIEGSEQEGCEGEEICAMGGRS